MGRFSAQMRGTNHSNAPSMSLNKWTITAAVAALAAIGGIAALKAKKAQLLQAASAPPAEAPVAVAAPPAQASVAKHAVFIDPNMPMDAEGRVHHLHLKSGEGEQGVAEVYRRGLC